MDLPELRGRLKTNLCLNAIGTYGSLAIYAQHLPGGGFDPVAWKKAKLQIEVFERDDLVSIRHAPTRHAVVFELRDLSASVPESLLKKICEALRDTGAKIRYRAPGERKFIDYAQSGVSKLGGDLEAIDAALAAGSIDEKRAIGLLVSRSTAIPPGTYQFLRARLQ